MSTAHHVVLDPRWVELFAELQTTPYCAHYFDYRDGCRHCEINSEMDGLENSYARRNGEPVPNKTTRGSE